MKEQVSALLDGETGETAVKPVLAALRQDEALRGHWEAYCLIGDVLRREQASLGEGFSARVMEALESEPTVLAPPRRPLREALKSRSLMPVAASVMAVVAVGLVASSLYPQRAEMPQFAEGMLAAQPVQEEVQRVASVANDDPHRNYMFAHQSMSGGGLIPGGVHYVRTVSDVRGEMR